jgi:hypothetical protein
MGRDHVVDRVPRLSEAWRSPNLVVPRQYSVIDPTELYVGYAGLSPTGSPMHSAIHATSAGDSVQLVRRGNRINLETTNGVPIGRLSEAGRKVWESRIARVCGATVIAMVRRVRDQETEEYRPNLQVDEWEFPVVEVCWGDQAARDGSRL